MLYFSYFLIVIFFSFLLIGRSGPKKLFNVPWYYRTVSLDIGKKKGKLYSHKKINGIPDAVFKHVLLPKYIVGELKGRKLGRSAVRGYEHNQIMLYVGILNQRYWGFVSGRLAYKDTVKKISYNKAEFKHMLSRREEALLVLNQVKLR